MNYNLNRVPTGLIIIQPNLRGFREFKFAVYGTTMCPRQKKDNEDAYNFAREKLLPCILMFFLKHNYKVPIVWRLDLTAYANQFYLNEIEIVGARYKFINIIAADRNLEVGKLIAKTILEELSNDANKKRFLGITLLFIFDILCCPQWRQFQFGDHWSFFTKFFGLFFFFRRRSFTLLRFSTLFFC